MAALQDPLRNTLDHLALDPQAREDRRYLVSMLRRLGYSDREIEAVLGYEGDGPRIIEVEYVPPGQRPAGGSFTVVDDWQGTQAAPEAETTIGFSVVRDEGDHARAHGWLAADDPAVAHGWLPDTVAFKERGAQAWSEDDWEPLDQEWPQEPAVADEEAWTEAPEAAWAETSDGEWVEAPETEPSWTEEAPEAWPEEAAEPLHEDAHAPWPEQAEPPTEGQWHVVEETEDPWTETEADWAQGTQWEETWQPEGETWQPDGETLQAADEVDAWAEPTEPVQEYEITDAPGGSWTPSWDAASQQPFMFEDYTLYTRMVELSTGREQRIFFFAKNEPKSGKPCALPPGYIVETNERTGLPFLRRDPEAEQVDVDWDEPEQELESDACLAVTRAGSQCRNAPRDGSKYCVVHKGWRGPRVE